MAALQPQTEICLQPACSDTSILVLRPGGGSHTPPVNQQPKAQPKSCRSRGGRASIGEILPSKTGHGRSKGAMEEEAREKAKVLLDQTKGGTCENEVCVSNREELQKKRIEVKLLQKQKRDAEKELERVLVSKEGELERIRKKNEERITQENEWLKKSLANSKLELKEAKRLQRDGLRTFETSTRETNTGIEKIQRDLERLRTHGLRTAVIEEISRETNAKIELLHEDLTRVIEKMNKTATMDGQLKEAQQHWFAYEKQSVACGNEVDRLKDLLEVEQKHAARLSEHLSQLEQFNSKRCPRQASECDKVHQKSGKSKETAKAEKQKTDELERLRKSTQDENEKLSARVQELTNMLESPECQKPHCVQLEQRMRDQQKTLQIFSPMKNMAQQYDGHHDQLKREYDELMTNPDGILGQLEREFDDPFDAKVVLAGIFMAAYEESKNYLMEFVGDNLKQLFTVQPEQDEEKGDSSEIDIDDLSRAFGLLLYSTAARTRLTCSTSVSSICKKVKHKIPKLEPCKRTKIKIKELPVKKVVELTWKFITLPNPMIVCQPETFSSVIHSRDYEHWNPKLAQPYQLIYARPVLYRSYHGLVACKGLVGNECGTSVDA